MSPRTQFQVRGVHQIEMTSRCNLRCRYCTHPKMPRAKEDMSDEVYRQSLRLAAGLLRVHGGAAWAPGRPELNLAGIGESTMHPEFVRNVHLAREAVGPSVDLILATNGLLVDRNLARAIRDARPKVWVSLHRQERARAAVDALRAEGLLCGVSIDPAISSVDWAGQVDWAVTTPAAGSPCPWVRPGKAFVLSDGRVARCCFDAVADDVIGTVFDEPSSLRTAAYNLCRKCHFEVGADLLNNVEDPVRNGETIALVTKVSWNSGTEGAR